MNPLLPIALLAVLTAAGCASDPQMRDGVLIDDPYEAANRRVHAFNKGVDAHVVGPVANRLKGDGADAGPAPQPGDPIGPVRMMANAGRNLSLPGKALNGLLQGRPGNAGMNALRFATNTTVGLGGLFDPAADSFGWTERDTDFGETLAVWGAPEGAYLELPLIGPSTLRDTAGRVVDIAIDPLGQVLDAPERRAAFALRVGAKATDRARFGDTIDGILQGSADSYAQTRLIWLMNRRHELGEESADIDPYGDDAVIDPYE
ncbi:MlaA family lipoprotein [Paracoccus zeaxanthinifaciens]|uniref:MlaA family lipoprotein n=1 Tax=Paracoccus zeaxanthinifaciens TaxID=187400 RepID=UPI0003B6E299|nr:VacJ family lipoprotein [Paracoccus zeaxanthinifaciens]